MVNAFTVSVSQSDWDDGLGGWRCPALAIPGANVEAVYDKGHKIDDAWYEVLVDHRVLRWIREERPDRITISIALTKELSTQIETLRWKKLAIILPAAATILSAAITSASLPKLLTSLQLEDNPIITSRLEYRDNPQGERNQSQASNEFKVVEQIRAESFPSFIEDVNISFPRGNKVIIRWKGMPEDKSGTEVLRKIGVSIDDVDSGTKLAFSALAQRNSEGIHYVPLVLGNKPVDGHSYAALPPSPSPDAGYNEFQLFQKENEFTVILLPIGLNFPPLEPSEININWEQVRTGLKRALNAMYKDTKSIEFENVGIYKYGEAHWQYRLPYRIIPR